MSSLRLAAALVVVGGLLAACNHKNDIIQSETAEPTSDQSTEPPPVDTEPPSSGDTDSSGTT